MDKLKKLFSPGHEKDDDTMYGSGSSDHTSGHDTRTSGEGSHLSRATQGSRMDPSDTEGYSRETSAPLHGMSGQMGTGVGSGNDTLRPGLPRGNASNASIKSGVQGDGPLSSLTDPSTSGSGYARTGAGGTGGGLTGASLPDRSVGSGTRDNSHMGDSGLAAAAATAALSARQHDNDPTRYDMSTRTDRTFPLSTQSTTAGHSSDHGHHSSHHSGGHNDGQKHGLMATIARGFNTEHTTDAPGDSQREPITTDHSSLQSGHGAGHGGQSHGLMATLARGLNTEHTTSEPGDSQREPITAGHPSKHASHESGGHRDAHNHGLMGTAARGLNTEHTTSRADSDDERPLPLASEPKPDPTLPVLPWTGGHQHHGHGHEYEGDPCGEQGQHRTWTANQLDPHVATGGGGLPPVLSTIGTSSTEHSSTTRGEAYEGRREPIATAVAGYDGSPYSSRELDPRLGHDDSHGERNAALVGGADTGLFGQRHAEAEHEHGHYERNRLHKDPPAGHPAAIVGSTVGLREHVGVDGPIGIPDKVSGLRGSRANEALPASQEGIVIEPTTGLPMNVGKYGSGHGGTDSGPIPGFSPNEPGYNPRASVGTGMSEAKNAAPGEAVGADWEAIKKANTPY